MKPLLQAARPEAPAAHAGSRPPAVVLGLGVNGLSVARALASEGVEVHGVWSGGSEPGRYSRHCRTTAVAPVASEQDFVAWLVEHTGRLDRPVVLPTSDRFALWLARHRPRLAETCRLWTSSAEVVESLLRKDRFRASGEIFALDFNPRSLYGNSHILAAGVNLPHLAYRDLCGHDAMQLAQARRSRRDRHERREEVSPPREVGGAGPAA